MSQQSALPIRQVGDPVLATACAPVERFDGEDGELGALVRTMFASMYAAEGVGLAANQIGVGLRVFVYDCPDASGDHQVGVVVNPVLQLPAVDERQLDDAYEGCLSVAGQRAALARPDHAVVTGFDVRGEPVTVTGTGILARCLQHETDHLNGMLYIDRLPVRVRKAVLAAYQQDMPYFPDWVAAG